MHRKPRQRLYGKNKKIFFEGLKKYQEKGIPILIDGKEAGFGQFEKILEIQDDGSFYMGDYVWEHKTCTPSVPSSVFEEPVSYKAKTEPDTEQKLYLKEIRFDKVYH